MSTYSLQLLDSLGSYGEGTEPFGPRAYIALKTSSEVTWQDKSRKKINFTVITPECVTVDEFRFHVRRLMKELKMIEKHAEKFFVKDIEKKRARLSTHVESVEKDKISEFWQRRNNKLSDKETRFGIFSTDSLASRREK